jgi:TonB family protein
MSGTAQTADSSGVYTIATTMPSYQGGEEALYEFINQHINYPKEALEQKKQGTVQLSAVIDEGGYVSGVKVVRGVSAPLDDEAVRVINSTSGKWIAGMIDGKPVKVYKYLRVSFKIDATTSTPAETSAPTQPLKFIGGDSAFYTFIKTNVQVPNTVLLHPEMMIPVNVLVTFSPYNQISEVMAGAGSYRTLNDEAIRLVKLSQGKWVRSDFKKIPGEVKMLVIVPFDVSMIDTNSYKGDIREKIIFEAYNSNPVFARAYDNYRNGSYDVAIIDLNDCINENKNHDAALLVRAFCYLSKKNKSAACEDLVRLRESKDAATASVKDLIEDIYFKYCTGSDNKENTPGYHINISPSYRGTMHK